MSHRRETPLWVDALLDRSLTWVERVVLAYLAWRQGGNGSSWPSQQTIAQDLGLTTEAVRKITKRLEAAGWIVTEWPNGPGRGKEHVKRYAVKTPTAVLVSSDENPNGGLGITAENPNSRTAKTPTAKPRYIMKNTTGTQHTGAHTSHSTSGGRRRTPKARGTGQAAFTPPTVDEVVDYAESRGDPQFDAAHFVEYYEDRGWTHKGNKPMKDWQQTVRDWIRRDNQRRIERGEPPHDGYSQYGTRPVTEEEALAALEGRR